MKVLLRAILYKAISPPYRIVDMENEVWIQFLNGDKQKRIKIACDIVNNSGWTDSLIREIAWIPLDNNKMLKELAELLKIKQSYIAKRLLFKADIIEPLSDEDIFAIHTPEGTFQMTKADFYRVFDNVVKSDSYSKTLGFYHYPKIPQKAMQFLVK